MVVILPFPRSSPGVRPNLGDTNLTLRRNDPQTLLQWMEIRNGATSRTHILADFKPCLARVTSFCTIERSAWVICDCHHGPRLRNVSLTDHSTAYDRLQTCARRDPFRRGTIRILAARLTPRSRKSRALAIGSSRRHGECSELNWIKNCGTIVGI